MFSFEVSQSQKYKKILKKGLKTLFFVFLLFLNKIFLIQKELIINNYCIMHKNKQWLKLHKTASKKIRVLIHSIKFFSPEVALYLYKSTIQPCMEYCCHIRAGAPCCHLELLDKVQKWICRTVGPSLVVSLKPLAHCQNVVSWSLFYRSTVSFLAQLDSGILSL